jgi:hypothetical protein
MWAAMGAAAAVPGVATMSDPIIKKHSFVFY